MDNIEWTFRSLPGQDTVQAFGALRPGMVQVSLLLVVEASGSVRRAQRGKKY
jgi:hypothetical protein